MIRSLVIGLITLGIISCHTSQKNKIGLGEINAFQYQSPKTLVVDNAAVVTAHPLASKIGLAVLQQGGNAFDAAIATQLALAVVYPQAGNLGGGGFMVARKKQGDFLALDFREMAPLAAHRDMYIDSNGNARTDKSQEGHLSSGVPGTVAGLFAMHLHGRTPFQKLIQPAIELAEHGFVITHREASNLNELQEDLKAFNTQLPVFVREREWKEGDTLIQKDLAETLKRIQKDGQAGFYEGETARLLVEEMKRGGGIITEKDLKNYEAIYRKPHLFEYKGHQVLTMPMPSSGGLLLNQMMKMIEKKNIAEMGFHSVEAVQLMTEVERIAFADRGKYMGDPDFYKVPVNELVSEEYLANRMKLFVAGKAGSSTVIDPGTVTPKESEETTHLSIIDKEGNAVAVTTTLNNSYGSLTVIGGAGFFMNDEMDDFSIKPGVPNMYGAIGGEANAIQPKKRMLSSMTPTIVLKDGKPIIIVGTPGGTTIPTSVFQSLVNILEFKMSAEDAVYKPKFHHQWLPDTLELEKGFPVPVRDSLVKMGYNIEDRSAIGRTELILILPNGKIQAIADRRGDDAAEGY